MANKWAKTSSSPTLAAARAPTADSIAAENTRKEEQRYQDLYRPINQDLIAELGENRLLEAAKAEVAGYDPNKSAARLHRQAGRIGTQVTQNQVECFDDMSKLETAKDTSFTLANARMTQRNFNDNLRTELINTGRGIAKSGNNGLQEAANLEASRNAANDAAKAASKAQTYQAIGAGVGTAAMLAIAFM